MKKAAKKKATVMKVPGKGYMVKEVAGKKVP